MCDVFDLDGQAGKEEAIYPVYADGFDFRVLNSPLPRSEQAAQPGFMGWATHPDTWTPEELLSWRKRHVEYRKRMKAV